jgi:hypothetical protein
VSSDLLVATPPRRAFAYWPGLLLAPVLFLAYQLAAYIIVPWACRQQAHGVLHAVSAAVTVAMLMLVVFALMDWRREARAWRGRAEPVSSRRRLLSRAALAVGALSLAATLALWFTQFVIGPCVS